MIDICMALDQSLSLHTGVQTIQNTGFSGMWYFNHLVPTPFFGTRLCLQNFNLAPTQLLIPPPTQAKESVVCCGL